MDINAQMQDSLNSVRQSIGIVNLRRAINQDQQSMDAINKMADQNSKIMERSVTVHKGNSIDTKV